MNYEYACNNVYGYMQCLFILQDVQAKNPLHKLCFSSAMLSACRHSNALLLLLAQVTFCSISAALPAHRHSWRGTTSGRHCFRQTLWWEAFSWPGTQSWCGPQILGFRKDSLVSKWLPQNTWWGIRHLIALTILLSSFGKQESIWDLSCCSLSRNRNAQLPVAFP